MRAIERTLGRKIHRSACAWLALVSLLLFPSGCGGLILNSPAGTGSGASSSSPYAQQAATGIASLQGWYSQTTGLYASPSGWWNAANSITVLADYEEVTGSTAYNSVLSNTFLAAQKSHANFLNSYYDDDGWWALAWIEAYDVTGNPAYLAMAETIFTAISGSWDSTCGGGVWWNTSKGYKNAVPNELFLTIAAKLANRTTGAASANYLSWAQREWTWFKASGMINAQNLINDGLTSTNPNACTNNGGTTWTYNQGVILGGLVELSKADNDPSLLPEAQAIAGAAIANLSKNGILIEPGSLSGGDAPQFKGVFLRNLMEFYAAAPSTQLKAFADANAASIVANDQGPNTEFGGLWQGPFDSADATRQTSALDALIAAAAMQ
jgi:predicted alpha-1,6-mannanase (GH76 family)